MVADISIAACSLRATKATDNWLPLDAAIRNYSRLTPLAHTLFRGMECRTLSELDISHAALDLGCGDGEFLCCAVQGQFDAGVDLSAKKLRRAERTGKYRELKQGDAAKLPFEDDAFASILSVSVMEHIARPQEALAEALRVLRPGGRLVATIVLRDLEDALFYPWLLRKVWLSPLANAYVRGQRWFFQHRTLWTQERWEAAAVEAGFEIVTSRRLLSRRASRWWDALLPLAIPSRLLQLLGLKRFLPTPRFLRRFVERLARDAAAGGSVLLLVAEKPL